VKQILLSGILATMLAINVNAQIPTNGLVAWWSFNGNANDESGNGHNGVVLGATMTTDRFGNNNSAFDFNGISDEIIIPSLNNHSYKPASYAAWILADSLVFNYYPLGGGVVIIGRERSTYTDQGALMIFDYQDGGHNNELSYYTGAAAIFSNSTPQLNIWHHVVCTIQSDDTIKFYLNGSLISSQYFPTNSAADIPFKIGAGTEIDPNYSRFFWNGKLDDLGFWDRALSDAEILQLFNAQTTGTNDLFTTNNIIGVYPNPTNSQINFSVQTNVHLTNITGQIVANKKNINSLDISEQPAGIYFVTLTDDKGQVLQRSKIVKE